MAPFIRRDSPFQRNQLYAHPGFGANQINWKREKQQAFRRSMPIQNCWRPVCLQDVNFSGFSDLTRFATSAQQVVRSSRQLAAAQVRANRAFIAACIDTLQISQSIAAGRPCNEHFIVIVVKFRLQEMFFS